MKNSNFKTHASIRENIQNRTKVLKFRKKKWKNFIAIYLRKSIPRNKYRLKDPNQYVISKQANRWFSYKNCYKNSKLIFKKFKFFYGGFSNFMFKKYLKTTAMMANRNVAFLTKFDQRLDVVLYQSKMAFSLENSKQMILHGNVFINNKQVKSRSFLLSIGDLISLNKKYHWKTRLNLQKSQVWPFPPKHLVINYKTMQIVFCNVGVTNFGASFFYGFQVDKIILSKHFR